MLAQPTCCLPGGCWLACFPLPGLLLLAVPPITMLLLTLTMSVFKSFIPTSFVALYAATFYCFFALLVTLMPLNLCRLPKIVPRGTEQNELHYDCHLGVDIALKPSSIPLQVG